MAGLTSPSGYIPYVLTTKQKPDNGMDRKVNVSESTPKHSRLVTLPIF
jgi:hypothetical protein